jgi:flagellar basal-body rod protein FlgF
MDRLAFNAAAFINASRIDRQMTMNELSNASTNGFKRSFESSMKTVKAEGAGFESRLQPQGVNTDYINMKPGTMMVTGRDLDISLNDQAVLGVTASDGTLAFTRRGDLRVNNTGALETGAGSLVRGQAGGPITIPPGFRVTVNPDGSVYATNPAQAGLAQPVLIDRLLLRDSSQTPLERREDGLFMVSGKPLGTDIPANDNLLSLTPKALESSNVNPMEVMVKLMEQSRSFEQAVNVIKQSKDADQTGSTMMKPA